MYTKEDYLNAFMYYYKVNRLEAERIYEEAVSAGLLGNYRNIIEIWVCEAMKNNYFR